MGKLPLRKPRRIRIARIPRTGLGQKRISNRVRTVGVARFLLGILNLAEGFPKEDLELIRAAAKLGSLEEARRKVAPHKLRACPLLERRVLRALSVYADLLRFLPPSSFPEVRDALRQLALRRARPVVVQAKANILPSRRPGRWKVRSSKNGSPRL